MATKNPRISVMLKPESDAILTRLSVATKQSKSSLIGELLEGTCMPMFERMAIVLEAAATATDDAKEATRKGFRDAEEKLLGIVGMSSDLFDEVVEAALERTDGRTRERPPARPDPAPRPPHVTRGSGTPNTATKADDSPMKMGSFLGTNAKYSAACEKSTEKTDAETTPKRAKRPSKALKQKVGG